MSRYLDRYIGIYRVKAHYDEDTKDFPRDHLGNIDPTFNDFYIDCKNKIEIRHSDRDILACYIPSLVRGKRILRAMISNENIEVDKLPDSIEKIANYCQKHQICQGIDITDGEVYIYFKADKMDFMAKLVGARTSGANIKPFSTRNLPKEPYKIPAPALSDYKAAISDLEGLQISALNNAFIKLHPEAKNKALKCKESAHKLGLWDDYIKFLQNERAKLNL